MTAKLRYSPYFETLYDQQEPVGSLGRGTHYSVLRSVTWLDENLKPINPARLHDLAVIWDEDHDERIVEVLDALYLRGLLAPVHFVGERKGMLTLLLAPDSVVLGEPRRTQYCEEVESLDPATDSWGKQVSSVDAPLDLIHTSSARMNRYLATIADIHMLGQKQPND